MKAELSSGICILVGIVLAAGSAVMAVETPGRGEAAGVRERTQHQARRQKGEEMSEICGTMYEEEKAAMRAEHRAYRELRDAARGKAGRMREKRQAGAAERRNGFSAGRRAAAGSERWRERQSRLETREDRLRGREARRNASEK